MTSVPDLKKKEKKNISFLNISHIENCVLCKSIQRLPGCERILHEIHLLYTVKFKFDDILMC